MENGHELTPEWISQSQPANQLDAESLDRQIDRLNRNLQSMMQSIELRGQESCGNTLNRRSISAKSLEEISESSFSLAGELLVPLEILERSQMTNEDFRSFELNRSAKSVVNCSPRDLRSFACEVQKLLYSLETSPSVSSKDIQIGSLAFTLQVSQYPPKNEIPQLFNSPKSFLVSKEEQLIIDLQQGMAESFYKEWEDSEVPFTSRPSNAILQMQIKQQKEMREFFQREMDEAKWNNVELHLLKDKQIHEMEGIKQEKECLKQMRIQLTKEQAELEEQQFKVSQDKIEIEIHKSKLKEEIKELEFKTTQDEVFSTTGSLPSSRALQSYQHNAEQNHNIQNYQTEIEALEKEKEQEPLSERKEKLEIQIGRLKTNLSAIRTNTIISETTTHRSMLGKLGWFPPKSTTSKLCSHRPDRNRPGTTIQRVFFAENQNNEEMDVLCPTKNTQKTTDKEAGARVPGLIRNLDFTLNII